MKTISGQEIELLPPLKDIAITQKFNGMVFDYNSLLGITSHNGIDYLAKKACPVYASHDGNITWAGKDGDGGISVQIIASPYGLSFYTLYYHLLEVKVEAGQKVKAGQLIGLADNTGRITSGSHLHFGLKETFDGATINKDNGWRGAIDPYPYFPKDFDKPHCYHRYGKPRNWYAEFCVRFAPVYIRNQWAETGRFIHRELKKMGWKLPPTGNQVNAIIYGAWDWEYIIDPLMEWNWSYLTKSEWQNGRIPFFQEV